MKKLGKAFWITIGIGAILFLVLILLSSVLSLGDRLAEIGPWAEYSFYAVSALLFLLLVVRPILIVVLSPTFSMDSVFDEKVHAEKNYHMYKKVAQNLLLEDYLSAEQKEVLNASLGDPQELKVSLGAIFDEPVRKELNKLIVRHAETVFLSTAISQNGRLDLIAVLVINLRLIKELVVRCGFRPSYASLGRLAVSVLSSAVIAESLEDINFNEIFPNSSIKIFEEVPFLKTIVGSLGQGAGNALLSLRVGIICRNYLFMNLKGQTKAQIRKNAFAEAMLLFPSVLAESVKKMPSRLKALFEKAN